jgi:hypothetical protein
VAGRRTLRRSAPRRTTSYVSLPLFRKRGVSGCWVLAEQVAVQPPCLAFRFEPEPFVEVAAESLVALDHRVPPAERGFGFHRELDESFVAGVERECALGRLEGAGRFADVETLAADPLQQLEVERL